MIDDETARVIIEEIRDTFSRIMPLLERLHDRVEVLELKDLHRQASGDGMMEIQAGCTDAETSEQP
jgi:hypothetical protein